MPGVWLADAGRTCGSQGCHGTRQPFWKERDQAPFKGPGPWNTHKWSLIVDSRAHQDLFLKSGFSYDVQSGKN